MKIAIIGATGVVGRKVLQILEEKKLLNHNFILYASAKSKKTKIQLGKKNLEVKELTQKSLKKDKPSYALFCAGGEMAKEYVPYLLKLGCKTVDLSSYFRQNNYPLVVPEVNKDDIFLHHGLVCNPNCSTIAAVVALNLIHKKFGLKKIIYSTYQAVSGAGKAGLDDILETDPKNLKKFDFLINNNLIPYIGQIDNNGYTVEEMKMINETHKILHDYNIDISATCVRVPVDVCHSESIYFETKKDASLQDILTTLGETPGVLVKDSYNNFPMPLTAKETDFCYVGRVRKDLFLKNAFNIWIVSDNIRKGAATNAVQILEYLLKENKNEKRKYCCTNHSVCKSKN